MRQTIFLAILLTLFSVPYSAQDLTNVEKLKENPRRYVAPFYSVGNASEELADFSLFNLWFPKKLREAHFDNSEKFERIINSKSKKGYIRTEGRLITETRDKTTGEILYSTYYPFAQCKITLNSNRIEMTFKTVKYKGIRYDFDGYFYETGDVYPESETIRLKGILRKYVNEVKAFEVNVLMRPDVFDVD